jgi:hypothetical protein
MENTSEVSVGDIAIQPLHQLAVIHVHITSGCVDKQHIIDNCRRLTFMSILLILILMEATFDTPMRTHAAVLAKASIEARAEKSAALALRTS